MAVQAGDSMNTTSCWNNAQMHELVSQPIRTWSVRSGVRSKSFVITDISGSTMTITACNGSTLTVSRDDFESIEELWRDYLARLITRGELVKTSRRTTYILSILHLLKGSA
jgi:hypothetical protein